MAGAGQGGVQAELRPALFDLSHHRYHHHSQIPLFWRRREHERVRAEGGLGAVIDGADQMVAPEYLPAGIPDQRFDPRLPGYYRHDGKWENTDGRDKGRPSGQRRVQGKGPDWGEVGVPGGEQLPLLHGVPDKAAGLSGCGVL